MSLSLVSLSLVSLSLVSLSLVFLSMRLSIKQLKKVLKSGDDVIEQIKSSDAYKDLLGEDEIQDDSTVTEVAKVLAKKMLYNSFLDKIYESTGFHIDDNLDNDKKVQSKLTLANKFKIGDESVKDRIVENETRRVDDKRNSDGDLLQC